MRSALDLLLFTPPTTLPHEHATLNKLAARAARRRGGDDPLLLLPAALHVRKPGADEDAVADYLRKLPRELLERAVLHSHHGLADRFQVKVCVSFLFFDMKKKGAEKSVLIFCFERFRKKKKRRRIAIGIRKENKTKPRLKKIIIIK